MRILFMCIIAGLSLGAFAQEDEVAAKIEAAMAADIRTEADTARDRNRKPVETLGFFQFSDDMRVLELLPGVQQNLLQQPGFDHVKVLDTGVEFERTGPFNTSFVGPFDFGVSDIDLAVTFRNMHGFTPEGQANINAAVFSALRPGGFYGVIDHSRRHMQQINSENRRRVDVVQVIKDVLDAGFVFVDYSDLHYRPDDELRYEVGRATVTGNTDRFTLLFRKP
jgi:predicted methyltransferase